MLYDAQGRPLSPSRRMPEASRDAGAFRGSLSHWRGPQIQSRDGTSREREVIELRFKEGLTQIEMAERLGISQVQVSRLLRRTLKKIQDKIDPSGSLVRS